MKKGFTHTSSIFPHTIFNNKIKCAFTLAEVLITLGIIGIVAALTIPSMITKHQEKEYLSRFETAYKIINDAYKMSQVENGTADDWGVNNGSINKRSSLIYQKLSPYLKIEKVCDHEPGCFPNIQYKDLQGVDNGYLGLINDTDSVKFILSNGMLVKINDDDDFGTIMVDTNGFKGPNRLGYDLFIFSFYQTFVTGLNLGTNEIPDWQKEFCSYNKKINDGWVNGNSCSMWIIKNHNMDYLHREVQKSEW